MSETGFWRGTAIVTAAGSELGGALIERFAAEGMAIIAIDEDRPLAEAKAVAVRGKGGQAIAFGLNGLNRSALKEASKIASQIFEPCTVLCANVGLTGAGRAPQFMVNAPKFSLDTRAIALVNIVSVFLPLLRMANGNRRILITAPDAGWASAAHAAKHDDPKYTIIGLSESLRLALVPEGLGVSMFFPDSANPYSHDDILAARPEALGSVPKPTMGASTIVMNPKIDTKFESITSCDTVQELLAGLARNEDYIFGR